MQGRVLIVAGSDSGGGAGIQADIKTVTALGGYAATAVTALTAQNTRGVFAIWAPPPEFVAEQMGVVLTDIGADCIKTGMLHNAEIIGAVADALGEHAGDMPLVVDPVMVAKGGESLLDPQATESLKSRLLPRATVITPNLPEAGTLLRTAIGDLAGMKEAAQALLALGPKAALVKGGHLPSDTIYDVLAVDGAVEVFESTRIETPNTHGTGCTLASAIATGLAQNMLLRDAVMRARFYVQEAIRQAPEIGHGHGPLNHAHTIRPFGLD